MPDPGPDKQKDGYMFIKPWDGRHEESCSYHLVDTLADVKRGFKRCRKPQEFIIRERSVAKFVCEKCEKNLAGIGNRCTYDPKTKKIEILCYSCSWDMGLGYVFGPLYDRVINQ